MPTLYAGTKISIGNIEILADNIFLGQSKVAINAYNYLDNDAYNFLNATNLLENSLISNTIDTLVSNLKENNIWNKLYAMYPLVGGTSNTCQYNLINTSSYQLAFSGSWNFNNNGISGSGTNNYAATGFRPLTASFDNFNKNNSFGVYVESNIAGGYDMGLQGDGATDLYLISRYSNNMSYFYYTSSLTSSNTDSRGFYIGTISGSATNNQVLYKNGTALNSKNGSGGNINQPIVFGAANPSAIEATSRLYGLTFIGKGLSSTDASNLYTSVQQFATSLGRNV